MNTYADMPCTTVLLKAAELVGAFQQVAESHLRSGHNVGMDDLCSAGKLAARKVEQAKPDDLVERVRIAVKGIEAERDELRDEVKRLKSELELAHDAYLVKDKAARDAKAETLIATNSAAIAEGRLKAAEERINKACMRLTVIASVSGDPQESLKKVRKVLRGEES